MSDYCDNNPLHAAIAIVDNCPKCGAPQCCPACCVEAEYEKRIQLTEAARELDNQKMVTTLTDTPSGKDVGAYVVPVNAMHKLAALLKE